MTNSIEERVAEQYSRRSLEQIILDLLRAAGKDVDRLTPADLVAIDEFHIGGRQATVEFGAQMSLVRGSNVLDVGADGGPSRYFAKEYGCRMTGIDLADEYVRVAEMLARRLGMSGAVSYLEHSVDTRAMMTGRSPYALKHRTNLYRVAAESMLSLSVATAVLGIARAALACFIERTRERRAIPSGASKAEYAPTQIRLAESGGELQAAELMIRNALDLLDQVADGAAIPNIDYRARVKWQAAYSAELCRRAVQRLFAGSGAHGVYSSSILQALLRNVQVGAQHASIDFDTAAESYGKLRLSQPGKNE